jgi:hypothetical protein
MKVNNWLILLLVIVGLGVGMTSLYMASLSGVMSKMGLVGGDFSQAIKVNQLVRQTMPLKESVKCDMWSVVHHIPSYLLSKGEERMKLSDLLGGERIVCGARLVKSGNVERGVYTIIKGLYYLKTHYLEMKILVQKDKSNCHVLANTNYENWVEAFLSASEGRVHEIVLDVYNQVQITRAGVEELCID